MIDDIKAMKEEMQTTNDLLKTMLKELRAMRVTLQEKLP